VLLVGVCVLLVLRWRGAGRVQRRALAPVLWTGAACATLGAASLVPDALGAAGVAQVVDYALIIVVSAVPFAFLVGLLRSSLSRAGAGGARRAARRHQRARRARRGSRRPHVGARLLASPACSSTPTAGASSCRPRAAAAR
jgi:hypothetical protein